MTTIKLKQLNMGHDLSIRFARDMGNNKVIHYKVPLAVFYKFKSEYKDIRGEVRDFICRTEKVDDVEFEPAKDLIAENKLDIQDVTDLVLSDVTDIRDFLLKESLLMNKTDGVFYKTQDSGMETVHLVYFLAISFNESELKQAIDELKKDLNTLLMNGLILGHRNMPFTLKLPNTTGLESDNRLIISCCPILDSKAILNLDGDAEVSAFDRVKNLGLKSLVPEGSVNNLNDNQVCEIIEINISDDVINDEYIGRRVSDKINQEYSYFKGERSVVQKQDK